MNGGLNISSNANFRSLQNSIFYYKENLLIFGYFYRVRGISLDIVKRRLDKGLYKRLDRFQEDLFACLERARRLSRTDSQVFEDSIELQAFYIRQRFVNHYIKEDSAEIYFLRVLEQL